MVDEVPSARAAQNIHQGTYNRLDDQNWPATMSSFRLDAFEVTVGRLRAFVEAYPGARPKAGARAHPELAQA